MTTPHITEDDDVQLGQWPDEKPYYLALEQQNSSLFCAVNDAWEDARVLLNKAEELQDEMQSIWDDLSSCMIRLRYRKREIFREFEAQRRGKRLTDEQ